MTETVIYKGPYEYYFVAEIDAEEYQIHTCNADGDNEKSFTIIGEYPIEESYSTRKAAQNALVAYAREWDFTPLTEDEVNTFVAKFDCPPDDEPIDVVELADDGDQQLPDDDMESEEKNPAIVGRRVTVNDREFEPLLHALDRQLNMALRTAVDAKQGFKVEAKLIFTPSGDGFQVFHETGYQFDPIKVKDKEEFYESLQIVLDESGTPIIPDDREHQMTFDDPEVGATITTDASGVVEKVELNDEQETMPPVCGEPDCPYYATNVDGVGGCGIKADADLSLDSDYYNVSRAVEDFDCSRPKVLAAHEIFGNQEMEQEEQVEGDDSLFEDDDYDLFDNGGDIA